MHSSLCGCLTLILLLFFNPVWGSFMNENRQPKQYPSHSPVPLKVNKITSTRTSVPHTYYSLPFCSPKHPNPATGNLAEILRGNHFEDSLYEINALETIDCRIINFLPTVNSSESCTEYGSEQLEIFSEKVKQKYNVHWTLDDLPAAVPTLSIKAGGKVIEKQYTIGYPLGVTEGEDIWINNHIDINILYGDAETDGSIVIVGFEVAPRSQWYDPQSWELVGGEDNENIITSCPYNSLMPYAQISLSPATNDNDEKDNSNDNNNNNNNGERGGEKRRRIYWTYSVHWEESEIKWENRWDLYLRDPRGQIHLVSILNALIIVLFLAVIVGGIIKRTVYCSVEGGERGREREREEDEVRWKTVGAEVFRAPSHPLLLSVLIGSGAHLIGMIIITTVFGAFGLLSPAQQGDYTSIMVSLFIVLSLFSGYFSTYCYKIFRGTNRVKNAVTTALSFPLFFFSLFFIFNIIQREAQSSATIPFSLFGIIVVSWFGISIPLVIIGSGIGFFFGTKSALEGRVHNNNTIRTVQRRLWYQRPLFSILFAGVLPFGVVVIEYFFVVESIWSTPIYNAYRFLLISFLTLFVTCTCTNIVVCFFHLNSGDPQWWWRPFLHGGASALYMFIYTTVIYFTSFHLKQAESVALYFVVALVTSASFFLITGTVGFASCFIFLQMIYHHQNHSSLFVPLRHHTNNNNSNNSTSSNNNNSSNSLNNSNNNNSINNSSNHLHHLHHHHSSSSSVEP